MSLTVNEGQMVIQDPSDVRVYQFDWDTDNLPATVTISSSSFTITVLRGDNSTPLTKDNEGILSGNRKTTLRLSAGTLDTVYEIANTIVTSETPTQTKERSFRLLIQDR